MELERLYRKDVRLMIICAVVAAVSLYVGVRYFFQAFPESSIDFKTTRQSSEPLAREFLTRLGLDAAGYRHAAIFDFDDESKIFLEREVGVEESSKLLDTTIRLWRWEHRWFRPLQKEELLVEITTKGEPVGFRHLLDENAPGADLDDDESRRMAETFLTGTMGRSLNALTFVKGSAEKRPHRTDHTFTWKLRDVDIKGADYRLEVGIGGDHVSSYQEFLKIPDSWDRSYKNLRAWNMAASAIDAVLLILTVVAMLVLLVVKIRGGDVRWGPAALLAAITFVLQTLAALNSLPTDLFGYDTTVSYPGFLLQKVLTAVLGGLAYGAAIFLIAAAAEPLYRKRFPKSQSLTGLLQPRAFRTKEFFISAMVGLTLTFFFFAYENVFYIIANHLGAWAPREVPYSDLLSTAFPWIFVLFFGWFPAISEEFISRMFSIPFFESLMKSRILAVVLAAFIWGFGHAEYPNQPFYIRGLEVGIAGIIFGIVLLRYGILAVVICHYSVDALYTAFVLIRSHNAYYVATGALSAGIFAILWIAAAIAYRLKGGFLPPGLTNARDRTETATPLRSTDPDAVMVGGSADVRSEGAAGGLGRDEWARAAAERGDRVSLPEDADSGTMGGDTNARGESKPYTPLTARRILIGLGVAAAFVALSLAPIPRYGDWADFKTTSEQARESAAVFLRGCGFEVSSYRAVEIPFDKSDPIAASYLLEMGGLDVVNETNRDRVPTPLWRVRFFIPEQHEEYSVSIDPRTGAAVGFERKLADDAPGATLDKSEALKLAERFVAARGQDPAKGELKEQSEKDEKARRDHTLVWEYPIEHGGEAKVRYEVVVQGDTVGSWVRGVKIPEEWERERTRQTVLFTALRYLKVVFLGVLAAIAMVLLVQRIRAGSIPWKFGIAVACVAAAAIVLTSILGVGAAWSAYDTAVPGPLFMVLIWVGIVVVTLFFALGGGVVGGLAGSLYPQARTMLTRAARGLYARDALIAGFVSLGFAMGLPALTRILTLLIPSGRLIEGLGIPASLTASIPSLGVVVGSVQRVVFLAGLVAILVAVLARYVRTPLARASLGAFFVLSFLPAEARKPAEMLFGGLSALILAGGMAVLIQFFLRTNPLSWVWSAWFALGYLRSKELMEQSALLYRASGVIALVIIVIPGLWLLKDAITSRRIAA